MLLACNVLLLAAISCSSSGCCRVDGERAAHRRRSSARPAAPTLPPSTCLTPQAELHAFPPLPACSQTSPCTARRPSEQGATGVVQAARRRPPTDRRRTQRCQLQRSVRALGALPLPMMCSVRLPCRRNNNSLLSQPPITNHRIGYVALLFAPPFRKPAAHLPLTENKVRSNPGAEEGGAGGCAHARRPRPRRCLPAQRCRQGLGGFGARSFSPATQASVVSASGYRQTPSGALSRASHPAGFSAGLLPAPALVFSLPGSIGAYREGTASCKVVCGRSPPPRGATRLLRPQTHACRVLHAPHNRQCNSAACRVQPCAAAAAAHPAAAASPAHSTAAPPRLQPLH